VDGFRNGRPMWVVVSKRFPYDIYGVFFDQHLVPEAVERAGANYTSVGPYVAAPDSLMPSMTVLMTPICKNWDTSPCHKDSSFTATPVDSIASVSVTFALTDGSTRRATYRPQEAEAVFLTMSAVDKLLIPYYTMIYGVDYARAERAELLRRFVRRP